jgi:hypothetical protein
MNVLKNLQRCSDMVGNPSQLGGIETFVADNGQARGSRIAWFNTGTGLRYKVMIDRCLDIADAFFNQHCLTWLSHNGVCCPKRDVGKEMIWLESFVGGLITTCGLVHIGSPEKFGSVFRTMHGRISNIPAQIESIIQPNIETGEKEMSISGTITESTVFGPSLRLKRKISSFLGESKIYLNDHVTNIGNEQSPHMLLYHCNFGFPLTDDGSHIFCNGKWKSRGLELDNEIFNDRNCYKKCPSILKSHSGVGEAAALIDPEADAQGTCRAGIYNSKLEILAVVSFNKRSLPCLSNWQHWGKREYVTALSPATNYPVGELVAIKQKDVMYIYPGETKNYNLEIEVVAGKSKITDFCDDHNINF